ncbi:MAG TPA: hypothetical protein VK620_29330, partial [Bradyrhizobium sp.]|nr:hypothetical protein [Bradyrhizobium sp.]
PNSPASYVWRLGTASPKTLKRDLSPSLIHQAKFGSCGETQLVQRFLQIEDLWFGQCAFFTMGLHQRGFGGACRLAGGGETDRWSNAADAVQMAIRVGDTLDNAIATT